MQCNSQAGAMFNIRKLRHGSLKVITLALAILYICFWNLAGSLETVLCKYLVEI